MRLSELMLRLDELHTQLYLEAAQGPYSLSAFFIDPEISIEYLHQPRITAAGPIKVSQIQAVRTINGTIVLQQE